MILKLSDVCTYYGESYILQGVSLAVEEGEIVALLGRNGVGKTTTLRSIIGLTLPKEGEIVFREKNIVGKPTFEIARMGISYVPQGRLIVPNLTVWENLEIAISKKGKGEWSFKKIFAYFPKLEVLKDQLGGHLSGGEQQMLAIARALLRDPTLILIDEPSEGLAPLVVQSLGDMIVELKRGGITFLLVEQNVDMALKIADRCYLMAKGKIEYEGLAKDIQKNDEVKFKYLAI